MMRLNRQRDVSAKSTQFLQRSHIFFSNFSLFFFFYSIQLFQTRVAALNGKLLACGLCTGGSRGKRVQTADVASKTAPDVKSRVHSFFCCVGRRRGGEVKTSRCSSRTHFFPPPARPGLWMIRFCSEPNAIFITVTNILIKVSSHHQSVSS